MSDSSDRELPDGWVTAELGAIAEIIGGGTPSRGDARYFGGEIVWLTPTEIPKETVAILSDSREKLTELGFRESSVRWVPAQSVLLTSRASIGYTAIAGTALTTNQGFASFTLPSGIEPKYLAWWLKAQKKHLEELAGGTTFKEISKATLRTVSMPVAPALEQQRIVAAIEEQFTRLDAGVAALKRAQAALKRYRAAVLKAAVEGRLTEAWRAAHSDVEPASALLGRILAERRAQWEADQRAKGKDSTKARYEEPQPPQTEGLPELPQGWVWATVEQLLREELANGISVKGSDTPPGTPSLKLSAMSDSGFDYDDRRYIAISDQEIGNLAICEEDFFVARGNGSLRLVGRGTIATSVPEIVVFPDTMIRLRFAETQPLARYINGIWASRLLRSQIEAIARTTAGIYKISQVDVRRFVLPLPPIAEQTPLLEQLEQRLSVVSVLEATIAVNLKRAERLRQATLERAFTGRLVPQDPADEPASALLERIRREQAGVAVSIGRNGQGAGDSHRVDASASEAVSARQNALWPQE